MPGIDRTTIITGPALVTFGGSSFWSKGDISLKPVNKRFAIETSSLGKVDERFSDRMLEISFEPAGQFNDTLAAVLWPYAATAVGTSLFGATDDALVIWGRDGLKITIHNAALTQMPSIRLAVDKTSIGPVKFTGLLAKSTDPTNAAAYYTAASGAYPGDAGFTLAEIWTQAPIAVWGSSPWDSFRSEAGWEISFSLKLAAQMADGLGTVDMTLQGLEVSAKAIPIGPTAAQVLTALKGTSGLGASLATTDDLVLNSQTVGAPMVTLNNAALVDADLGYGNTRKRLGVCEWIATRSFTTGTPDPLFAIAEDT
jgi:hypothetical protein